MNHAINSKVGNSSTEEMHRSIEEMAKDYQAYKIGEAINCYLLPVIIPLGLVGNILSLMVMVQLHNRKVKMCRYLAVMAITDTITLIIGVFYWTVTYIQSRRVSSWECKFEVYFLHLGTTYSVYVIVAMTCDRFTAIKGPFKHYMCIKERKLRTILIGGFLFLVIYNLPHLWTASVMANGIFCEGASIVDTVSKVFSWANICLAVLFPFSVLLVLNVTIILEVRKSRRFFQCFGAINIGSTGSIYSRHSQRLGHIEQGINLQRYKRTACNKANGHHGGKEIHEMERIVESDDEVNVEIDACGRKDMSPLKETEHINHSSDANEIARVEITPICLNGNKEINKISDIDKTDSRNRCSVELYNHETASIKLEPNHYSPDPDPKERYFDSDDDHDSLYSLCRDKSIQPKKYTRKKTDNTNALAHLPKRLSEVTNDQKEKNHVTPLLKERANDPKRPNDSCPPGISAKNESPDSPVQMYPNHETPPPSPSTPHPTHGPDHGHRNRDAQLTIMLLAVTFTFLVLSLPQYLRYIIYAILDKHASPETYATYMLMYHITNKLFFTNASVNFYLYCLSGSRFRNDIRNIFSRRKTCYSGTCRSSVINNSEH